MMRRASFPGIAALACLVFVGAVRADEAQDLLDRAIKGMGGQEKLEKFKAQTMKGKGTFHGLGMPIEYSAEWMMQLPDKSKAVIEVDVNGMQIKQTQITNGDTGWVEVNGMIMDLDEDRMKETKFQGYVNEVEHLVTLKDKSFQLSTLPGKKVGDRETVGLKVVKKGMRDITLYFDKEKGYLLRAEYMVKDVNAGGAEAKQEVTYSDYRDFDGMPAPAKLEIQRDGKVYLDANFSEVKFLEKLPAAAFSRPS